jgi:hypothetical protein
MPFGQPISITHNITYSIAHNQPYNITYSIAHNPVLPHHLQPGEENGERGKEAQGAGGKEEKERGKNKWKGHAKCVQSESVSVRHA